MKQGAGCNSKPVFIYNAKQKTTVSIVTSNPDCAGKKCNKLQVGNSHRSLVYKKE